MSIEESDSFFRLSDIDQQRSKLFGSVYDLQSIVGQKGEAEMVGEMATPRWCRFCGGNEGDILDEQKVAFGSVAHLIPHLLGNSLVLSAEECDRCNQRHSRYESALGEYTLPTRALLGTKGKTGRPTYKDRRENPTIRAEHQGDNLVVEVQADSDSFDFNPEEGRLTFRTPLPSYRPLHVFKSLAKVAYSLLDESELDEYRYYAGLLHSDAYDVGASGNELFKMLGYWFPGSTGVRQPIAALYKRKEVGPSVYVAKVFVIQFANMFWQIPLVSATENTARAVAEAEARAKGDKPPPLSMPHFPAPVSEGMSRSTGAYGTFTDDLSSVELRRGTPFETTFGFTSATRTEGTLNSNEEDASDSTITDAS